MGGGVSMIDGHIDEVLKPCLICGGEVTALDKNTAVCTKCGIKLLIVPKYKYVEYKGEWGK